VKLVPHDVSKPSFYLWQKSFVGSRSERKATISRFWKELEDKIKSHNGPPPGSIKDEANQRECWWVSLSPCYLALIYFDYSRRWFVKRLQRAIVLEINLSPGLNS
jgi:hypothetical protein